MHDPARHGPGFPLQDLSVNSTTDLASIPFKRLSSVSLDSASCVFVLDLEEPFFVQ